ncbi:hypothetical protein [Bacillus sp. NTK071]|uniref:hypothetical protein n=1 Tax=Bacillus sp. NTK071 TaxID=2802175 RepID=UPI001A8FF72B|nr:hypothetical protein [Bacillus sp. NTK071]
MSDDNQTTDPEKVNAEELPKVRAFENEFTRGFLQSIEETRNGYYPFLSGTGNYKMDFPADGIIGEAGYSLQEGSESYLIGNTSGEIEGEIVIKYYQFMKNEFKDSSLQTLNDLYDRPLEFEEKKLDGRSINIAFFEDEIGNQIVVGFIQNTKDSGAVEVDYTFQCKESNSDCTKRIEDKKKDIENWMETITFLNKNNSD